MKVSNLKRWGLGATLVGTLALGGCGSMSSREQTWTMATAEKVPAAVGKVKVANEKDGNTKVKVEVAHLAQPDEAFDNASTYVVWLKPQAGEAQNVGRAEHRQGPEGRARDQDGVQDLRGHA